MIFINTYKISRRLKGKKNNSSYLGAIKNCERFFQRTPRIFQEGQNTINVAIYRIKNITLKCCAIFARTAPIFWRTFFKFS